MQLTAMSIWLFSGLAVLAAGVLAALQYLRVRPRRVRVVTTLFWQQAAEQALARTLFERFRQPRTYLLLLAATLLLLLALAQPVFTGAGQPHGVVLLEAGLEMTAADNRFANALELVRAEAASRQERRVAVLVADPLPRLLKHFDESLATLESRLAEVVAAKRPVIREDLLRVAASLLAGRDNGEMVLVAAQPVTVTSGDAQVRVLAAGDLLDNAFILSAVFVPDAADLTRGAFHCRVGYTGKRDGTVKVKILRANQPLLEEAVLLKPGEQRVFLVSGVAADGQLLSASVTGDTAVAGDDRVAFQLPDRRRIRVTPMNGFTLPPVLGSLLRSLPEVTTEPMDGANLPVVRVGPPAGDAHIRIHPPAEGAWGTVRASGHPWVNGMVFEDALCRAPATPLPVAPGSLTLLQAGDSPLATLEPLTSRLTLSANLFDEEASLVRRTGYLVLWSKLLQHLAGWRNEPLTLQPLRSSRSADSVATDRVLAASLDNFDLAASAKAATPASASAQRPVWQLLLVAALALMTLEALLNIRGRIA